MAPGGNDRCAAAFGARSAELGLLPRYRNGRTPGARRQRSPTRTSRRLVFVPSGRVDLDHQFSRASQKRERVVFEGGLKTLACALDAHVGCGRRPPRPASTGRTAMNRPSACGRESARGGPGGPAGAEPRQFSSMVPARRAPRGRRHFCQCAGAPARERHNASLADSDERTASADRRRRDEVRNARARAPRPQPI